MCQDPEESNDDGQYFQWDVLRYIVIKKPLYLAEDQILNPSHTGGRGFLR